MAGQRRAQVGLHPEQLTLALGERLPIDDQPAPRIPSVSAQKYQLRDARGRFAAGAGGAMKLPRVRALPSRDSRGRFVAYPTSDAPSWYVFCCDGYRIPEDRPTPAPVPIAQAAPRPLPGVIARPRRAWLTRTYAENTILFVLFVVGIAWYWCHLPPRQW